MRNFMIVSTSCLMLQWNRRDILPCVMKRAAVQPLTFGDLVHHLRDERGWTQEQLARMAGITVGSVSNLERGVTALPNTDTVEKLAAAFDVTPEELDPRWLAERVAGEARSLAQRQAIQGLLALKAPQLETILDQLARLRDRERKPRRG
jgi:transcriptional regulator with XRE-family HTH domain